MLKVTIPLKNGCKIEIDGDLTEVKNNIENIGELFDTLKTAIGESIEPITLDTEIQETTIKTTQQERETPAIPKELNLSDAIHFILKTEFGDSPRTFNEIIEVLKTSAIYRSKGTVSGVLNRLVKKNRLRRLRESSKDQWKYTAN